VATEAFVRMRGELTAAGFDVQVRNTGDEARASLERTANQAGADAAIAVRGDEPLESVEVWVVDRVTSKSVMRGLVVQGPAEHRAELLAVRALELLRASFLEASIPDPEVPPAPPVAVSRFKAEAPAVRPVGWAVEAGAGLLNGMGTSVLPLVRGQRRLADMILLRVTAAGAGTRARAEGLVGSALIAQQFALLEGVWPLLARRRVHPMVSLGAGALHVSAQGRATWPYQASDVDRWSWLIDAGLGVRLALAGRYEAALELHGQLAQPYPVLRLGGQEVARGGRPNLVLALTVLAWL
jgi:hypothetical protein